MSPVVEGGRRAMLVAIACAVVGLGLTALRYAFAPRLALFSYLTAFAYFLGLSLASLVLLMIFHASRARWMVVVRRIIEVQAAAVIVFPLLFVPIALGFRILYPWAGPHEGLDAETAHVLHHRAVYLNAPFFFVRAALYFLLWILFSALFLRWSTRQDSTGEPRLTLKAWRLGAGGLPAIGLTLTFAAIDWLMTLSTHWFSSMWGVYYFAGSFVGALALVIIVAVFLSRTPALDGVVKLAHFFSLGKFLLAFTCFWAYIAFSQYMLTWMANLPDTVPFLKLRQQHGWSNIGVLLIVGHWAVPFFILLIRNTRLDPRRLAMVALWILFMHYVDLYWVVMPHARPDHVLLDWSHVTALVGVGGAAVATGIALMRGRHAYPLKDPFILESLRYSKL